MKSYLGCSSRRLERRERRGWELMALQMTPLTLGVFVSCFFYGMFVVSQLLPALHSVAPTSSQKRSHT